MNKAYVTSIIIRVFFSILFAIFALVHIQHLFWGDWTSLGLHWRVVDTFYGLLALVVVAGFFNNARASVIALYSYSFSQLMVISLLAVLGKTWLPYTSLPGAYVLPVLAILHLCAIAGEGFVIKEQLRHFRGQAS